MGGYEENSLKAMGVHYMGQRERKAGRVVFERDEVSSDSVLSCRPTVMQAGRSMFF